jgi:low affinity Fe/Cu permease
VVVMPGEGKKSGWFDRFAESASRLVSRPAFFTVCVVMVVLWMPSYFLFRDVNTWQLIINTSTTILTQLLVALLQNSQKRFEDLTIRQNRQIIKRLDSIAQHRPAGSPDT